jgi:outer membrane biosynthesis protein TonB
VLDDAAFERVRYYARQLLTAEDMRAEQDYFLERLRRHNRFLHGWGVACGCDVQPAGGGTPWQVSVSPGYVVTPQGDEIWIDEQTVCDVSQGNAPGQTVYLAVRYAELDSRPAPASSGGGACPNGDCEYTRIHDGFELATLAALPVSHAQATAADQQWCNTLRAWAGGGNPPPVPPCVAAPGEPWVVLATIKLPAQAGTSLDGNAVNYQGRRALYSASALRQFATCLGATPPPTTPAPTTPPPTTAPPTTPPPTTAPPTTPPPTTAPPTTPPPTTAPPTTAPPTAPPVGLTDFTITSFWDRDNLHHYRGTVTLSAPAPSGGTAVAISCDNEDIGLGPTGVSVTSGQTSKQFEFSFGEVVGQTRVIITATLGQTSISKTETIRLEPAGNDDSSPSE